jgi:hypothetical protein
MRAARAGVFAFGAVLALLAACNEPSLEVGYDEPAVSAGGNHSGGAGAGGSGGASACIETSCLGKTYKCGNCIDDDGDGYIDAADPECTGPCDNSEDSFFGDIPGQSGGGCRRDCYFDQDSGSGNDRCDWSYTCDRLSVEPSYPPSGEAACVYEETAACATMRQEQPEACLAMCLPLTPNGCDCFGCCELPARSGKFVFLGTQRNGVGTCDIEHVDDPSACAPCTQVPSCLNRCEDCEICAGTTTVGPRCTGTTALCSVGTPCGPGFTCPGTAYCITGCCIDVPR